MSAAGCTASLSDAATVTVNDLPVVASVIASTLCASGTAGLTATVTGGTTTAMTYSWNIGGTQSTTTVPTQTSQTLSTDTAFTVTVTNENGCTSDAQSGTITLPAVSQATISGATGNSCPATTVALTATAPGATSFTWYKNGSQVQTGTSSAYTATASGTYTVTGMNASCTGEQSSIKVVTISVCPQVPGCGTLRVYQTTAAYDTRAGTWASGNSYCTQRGARLPNYAEILCMCNNRSTVPGGLSSATYLAYERSGDNVMGVAVLSNGTCQGLGLLKDGITRSVRCVL